MNDDIHLVWLAAFLDGEGTFTLSPFKRKTTKDGEFQLTGVVGYTPVICASSIDKKLLQQCHNIAGGWISPERPNSGNRKSSYHWSCKGPRIDKILPQIIPFLISKRYQAAIVDLFRKNNIHKSIKGKFSIDKVSEETSLMNEQFKLALLYLNHRGRKETPPQQLIAFNSLKEELDDHLSTYSKHFNT